MLMMICAVSAVEEIVIGPGEDALHGVRRRMARRRRLRLETGGAQVVVVTHEALVATAAEVALEARVARDAFVTRRRRHFSFFSRRHF